MATIDYNSIINENIALIKSVVRRFKPKGKLEYDEYIQAGRLGLWKAAQKHIPEKGALSTIAVKRITWEILAILKKKKKDLERKEKSKEKPIKEESECSDSYLNMLPDTLTNEEKSVLNLLYEGNKKIDIYRTLGISQTKFNNMLKKVVRKIKRANKYDKNSIL